MLVGGCLWPISSNKYLAGIACRVLIKSAPISASAAEVITFFMIFAMLSTDPLLGGFLSSLERKKCPPALLRAFGSDKYDASLWTASIMLLLLYVKIASGWVAT